MAPSRKKFEEIAEHIELSIFSGRMSVGHKISSERELMNQFGVGRSTVREALFSLQRKGLIAARPGAAARVSRPDADTLIDDLSGSARHMLSQPDGVRQLQNARMLFEIGLARNAARQATREDLKILREALEANGLASDQPSFVRTDLTFHYTLAMVSHNPIFTSIHHALMGWLSDQRLTSARAGATRAEIFAQHLAIYDAIEAGDTAAAEDAMETHLTTVARYYWQAMSTTDDSTDRETTVT
jgi:GntR family transcriptional repressor for pyruvate dehydrogenase complex